MPRKKAGPRVVRSSSLLAGARCLASVAQTEEVERKHGLPSEVSNEGSRLGVAYHELQAFAAKHGYEKASMEMQRIARKHGADLRELGWLWSRLRIDCTADYFDEIVAEEKLRMEVAPGLVLEGTPDLVRVYNGYRSLDVIDWKSGRLAISDDPDAYGHDQVISYVIMAVQSDFARAKGDTGKIENARALVYPVRLGDRPTIYQMDAQSFRSETERILRLVIDIDRQRTIDAASRSYGLGNHCRYCDGRMTCPAYRKHMNAAVQLVDIPRTTGKGSKKAEQERKAEIERRVGEEVATFPMRAFTYMRLAGEVHTALKDALKHDAEFWGPIDTQDGKYLGFMEYQAPASLTTKYVHSVVHEVLSTRLSSVISGPQLDSILDEINERISSRPLLDRQRFGHHRK